MESQIHPKNGQVMPKEFFFNEVWRMDWGLGNPNKTAALIVMLMLAVWVLNTFRRWGFWVALTLFTGLGICLIHTFSRGGLVALAAGGLPLLWLAHRERIPRSLWIGLTLSALILAGAVFHFRAHERYGQGVVAQDRSISNRLNLWQQVPRMIQDAPSGWGLGNAGSAYMEWYQPLNHGEGYRTLVNSHLTWLVEFGWPLRLLYIMGWTAILMICWPSNRTPWLALSLGIWLAFAVAATFSSVAESIWLWVLPSLALIAALTARGLNKDWPPLRNWVLPPAATLAGIVIVVTWPKNQPEFPIYVSKNSVQVGESKPDMWLIQSEKAFGKQPGRSLRSYINETGTMTGVGLAQEVQGLPSSKLSKVIAGGDLTEKTLSDLRSRLKEIQQLILVNPDFDPEKLLKSSSETPSLKVTFGAFSNSRHIQSWEAFLGKPVDRIDGVANYYPNWASLLK
ncbi:MAG: O-antigen ligase family protein [Blastochloris sp.]|nr:O-antigen ligase family protein [Blastochloris sp.]